MTDEAGCTALDEITPTNDWYDYQWNTDGCYCSINWKNSYVPNRCDDLGEVINPWYKPGSGADFCITQAVFEMNGASFDACPEPTCDEKLGSNRGFASAYLKPSGSASELTNASQFETAVMHFQEMCAGDEVDTCGGDACEGVCVTGTFFGIRLRANNPTDVRGLSIHTFATRK